MVVPNLIENPGAGGSPGASVVPASIVVASSRADYAMSEAGLAAAIAAAVDGDDIYIGRGNITLTGTHTLGKGIRFHGASRSGTTITLSAGITAFSLGAFSLGFEDMSFIGDNSASQKLVDVTGSGTNAVIAFNRVNVGNSIVSGGVETIIDMNTNTKLIFINDCNIWVRFANANSRFVEAASTTTNLRIVDSLIQGWAAVNGNPGLFMVNSSIASLMTPLAFGQAFMVGSGLGSGVAMTFTGIVYMAACTVSATDLTFSGGAHIASSSIGNNVIATNGITMTGGQISVGATLGTDSYMTGVKPNGGTWTLNDSLNCVIKGCLGVTIVETGSADNNHYQDIASASTIIGANSIVEDAQDCTPEVLVSNVASSTYATSTNRYIPLSKVASPNEQYVQLQVRAERAGRLRLVLNYAMSVTDAGDVAFEYTRLQAAAGADPNGALTVLSTQTITPGAGTTFKTVSISSTDTLAAGDNYTFRVTRDDVAGDTHPGSFNLVNMTALIW